MNKNFNEIYQNIYTNGIEGLTAVQKRKNTALSIFIVGFLIILLFLEEIKNTILFIVLSVILLIDLLIFLYINSQYKKIFKICVMKKLVNLYCENLTFEADRGVSRREYNESRFDRNYDYLYSEDLISGKILENNAFEMSQVKTTREETHISSNGNTTTTTVTTFLGLFGVVELGEGVFTEVDITYNNILNRFKKTRVEVDSAEFEDKYDLFSSDKVRAMEIFTSELIDEINEFKKETGYLMQIRIFNNKLFFRVSCGDVFEVSFFKKALDYKTLYKYFKMIDTPITIISKLIENVNQTL